LGETGQHGRDRNSDRHKQTRLQQKGPTPFGAARSQRRCMDYFLAGAEGVAALAVAAGADAAAAGAEAAASGGV